MLPRVVLLLGLLGPSGVFAAPFNAYGYRTEPGTLGLNPYVGADLGAESIADPWGSLFVFAGITPWLDVAVAANGAFREGQGAFDSGELVPRIFPLESLELALAGHLTVVSGREQWLGPEIHLAGYPTPYLGFWVNAGARYQLGQPARPETFAWFAAEVTDEVPFFAFEVDLESSVDGEISATLIPSVGVWVGKRRETGLSAGWLLPTRGGDVGFGVWLWRTIDLSGEGRRRRQRPPPKKVAGVGG